MSSVPNQPIPHYSHYGLHNLRVSTHAQVVIAAPDGHLPLVLQRASEVVSHRKLRGQTIHRLKHAVRVIALLLLNLLLKKVIVLETGHCGKTGRHNLNIESKMTKQDGNFTQLLTQNMNVKTV